MRPAIFEQINQSIGRMSKYKPGAGKEEIAEEYGLDEVIKLSSNENPLGCADEVRQALNEEKFHYARYPDGECRVLREKLAEFYDLDFENVIVGNGSDQIIDLAAELVTEPGDEILMGDPTFAKYQLTCHALGVKPVKVELDEDFRHDLKAMQEAITERTRVIFICDPNNPTGTTVSDEELKDFLDEIRDDILVVIDQAYREYVTADDYFGGIDNLEDYPNLLVLGTFSKIYGLAALRVGYGLGSSEVIEHMHRIRNPFNVNAVAQLAAAKALECQDHIEKCREMNAEQRRLFAEKFEEFGLEYVDSQANFMIVDTGLSSKEAFEHFARRGVVVRSVKSFGLDRWIRFTMPPADKSEKVLKAFSELPALVEKGV